MLSRLFPDDVQEEAARRYRRTQVRAERWRWTKILAVPGALACLEVLVAVPVSRRQRRRR